MSKISDSEHEARLLKESKAASEKKRKLEEDIRIADARNSLLLESAAQKEIEAYKQRSLVPKLGPLHRQKVSQLPRRPLGYNRPSLTES